MSDIPGSSTDNRSPVPVTTNVSPAGSFLTWPAFSRSSRSPTPMSTPGMTNYSGAMHITNSRSARSFPNLVIPSGCMAPMAGVAFDL